MESRKTPFYVVLNDVEYINLSHAESTIVSDLVIFGITRRNSVERIKSSVLQSDYLSMLPIEYTTSYDLVQPGVVTLNKEHIIQSMADILLYYLIDPLQPLRAPGPPRPFDKRYQSAGAVVRAQTPRYTRPRYQQI